MASRSDIEAGKAYVTLYVKNSMLLKGLQAAQQAAMNLGSGFTQMGGLLTAAGAGILTPLAGMVAYFVSAGSALNDMHERTGESVGSLAELKYAAEQTGTSIEDIEKAIKFQQKSGSAETFDQVAARIAKIEDPARRTRAAIEAWGKAGTNLLPMVNDLQKLRQEARDLNLVPTEESVAAADRIGDAFDQIKSVAFTAAYEIGAALAPVLEPALELVKNISVAIVGWVKRNGELIRTVAKIGAVLLVAGAVVTGIGVAFIGVGTVIGGVIAAISGIASLVAAVLSPVGLVVAAVVGLEWRLPLGWSGG